MADYGLLHQFLVTATFHGFDGTTQTATFAGSDGGGDTTEIASVRPGGMAKSVKLPGLDDTEEMTLEKAFDRASDPALRTWLKANKGCDIDVLKQPLARNKVPVGTGENLTCILGSIGPINSDANSNDPSTWSVTVGVQE